MQNKIARQKGLIILLLCLAQIMNAQEPPPQEKPPASKPCVTCSDQNYSLIYYDFTCKSLYKLKKNGTTLDTIDMGTPIYKRFKQNEKIQIRIININRYLYDITVEGKDIKYESEMPALFSSLFYGDSTLLGTLLSRFSANASPETLVETKDSIKKTALNKAIDDFFTALLEFQQDYNKLQEQKLHAFTSCPKLSCCKDKGEESYAEIADKLLGLRILLSKAQLLMKDDETIKKDRKELQDFLAELKKNATACEKKANDLDVAIKKLTTEKDELKTKFETEKDEAKRAKLKEDLTTKEKDLAEKTKEKEKEGEKCDETKDVITQQILAKENDLKVYNDLNKLQEGLPNEQDLMALVLFLNNMIDQSQTYTTPPIFPKGNRLDLTIKINKSKDSFVSKMNIRPYDNDSVTLDIFIPRKPFVSFSSGSFITLGSYLQNKTYDWQALPNSTNTVTGNNGYILTENSYTEPPMGFSALVNVEWKSTPSFGWGFSGGVGLTIETKPRLAYFAGHSLFIGDARQLTITGGLAAMQVDKLTNDWQAVSDQQVRYSGNSEGLSYYKELKVGPFISLTFTPFK